MLHENSSILDSVWDLGGQTSIRPYWRAYYKNTDAVIYVVDSADQERLAIAKEELMSMLQEDELADASLLVFANKQDVPGALKDVAVSEYVRSACKCFRIDNFQ